MKKAVVPSVDDLKARMAARKGGNLVAQVGDKNLELSKELTEAKGTILTLREQLVRRKLKPDELKKTLDKVLSEYGVEPAEELVKLAMEKNVNGSFLLDVDMRIGIWKELLAYRMPKLKAMELHQSLEQKIEITIRRFSDVAKDVGKTLEMAVSRD